MGLFNIKKKDKQNIGWNELSYTPGMTVNEVIKQLVLSKHKTYGNMCIGSDYYSFGQGELKDAVPSYILSRRVTGFYMMVHEDGEVWYRISIDSKK